MLEMLEFIVVVIFGYITYYYEQGFKINRFKCLILNVSIASHVLCDASFLALATYHIFVF